jgi:hypothetical protein
MKAMEKYSEGFMQRNLQNNAPGEPGLTPRQEGGIARF